MAKTQIEAVLKLVDVQINPNVFRKISQSVAGMPQGVKKTSDALGSANRHAKGLNTTLSRTKTQLNTNERAARLFLQRMAQFAILLPTFATLNRAIQGSVKFLFEFDSALRDIVRIDIGNLESRMEEVGDSALATAQAFGVSAIEVLGVTRVFKQAGFTIEESQAKAQAAILATQVSTLKSAQAVEVFIAAAKQFGDEGQNAVEVLDRLAKVEDMAAVNAADVADAFRTGGNALAFFTKSIDDSIGMIAALREQTRKSGREVGTFFKTFATRVSAAGEPQKAIRALGVEIVNLDGSLRSGLDITNDLAKAFNNLSESQQATAAKSIAGVRQFESLLGVLKSVDRANELSANSSKAAGTADEKRRITDQKLERQLQKLIATGQTFAEALGDAGLTDLLSNAITLANQLLKIFGGITDTTGELGGNLAPLLALGGVALGKGIFGLAGGKGGKPTGPTPGQSGFIGPVMPTGFKAGVKDFMGRFSRLGTIAVSSAKAFELSTTQTVANSVASKSQGVQTLINAESLKRHTNAIRSNAVALKQSEVASLKQKRAGLSFGTALVGLTLAATVLPKIFGSIEDSLRSSGGVLGEIGGQFTSVVGESATMAAQFAILGPQAAAVAGIFGAVKGAGISLINQWKEHQEILKTQATLSQREGKITAAKERFRGEGPKGDQALDDFIKIFSAGVQNVGFDDLNEALNDSLEKLTQSKGFSDLNLSLDELREAIFGDAEAVAAALGNRRESLEVIAEESGRLEQFNQMMAGVEDGTSTAGKAFGLLWKTFGAGAVEVDQFTGAMARSMQSFADFKSAQKLVDLADGIRDLQLQLDLSKLGPDALADSLTRLQQEFLLTERASKEAGLALNAQLSKAIENLGAKSFFGGKGEIKTDTQFLAELFNAIETLDTEKIARFREMVLSLPDVTRDAAEQVLSIIDKRYKNELDLQKKQNDVTAEQNRRARMTADQSAEATMNAQAATARFSAELKQFGKDVDSDVLQQVQGLGLGDVEDVLGGTSGLSAGIQQLIQGAFGDPIQKAQSELAGVTADTEAKLGILARTLEDVSRRLSEAITFEERNRLEQEQRSKQLEVETVTQQGLIKATEAKIKVIEAEKEVAKTAAETEKKRLETLDKLSDASRKYANELRNVNDEFEQFFKERISDLLEEEADARGELKEAQKKTLDSTKELAEAYDSLIDAQFEFNNAIAEAQLKVSLLQNDIGLLTGEISSFDGQLNAIGVAFREALDSANITLEKRIALERQLAEETLNFLQQAQQEIQQAGLTVFGQGGTENQALAQGIQGLQFVVEQLGGSFSSFLGLSGSDFAEVSQTLLSLPLELRKQMLDALSLLPSSTSIGGFSVEQLQSALGQVGAGIAPEEGLPSLEELTGQQVEQMKIIQDLTMQQAQLQFEQVAKAEEAIALAEQQLEASQILGARAVESLQEVRDQVMEETAILDLANSERRDLMAQVVAADDKNTLMQIEKESQLFADQNSVFREVGQQIVQGVGSAINAKLSLIEAQATLGAATGHIPNIHNFATGNLKPSEAAGLLRAAMREKSAMPPGATLAVANTHEAIVPMNKGHVPNFQNGNLGVVPAEALVEMVTILAKVQSELEDISTTNAAISSNTNSTEAGTQAQATGSDVNITLQTNQQNTVAITGLNNLIDEVRAAVRDVVMEQAEAQVEPLLAELESVIQVLRERGLLSSFGQPG